jgi:endonuclease-3
MLKILEILRREFGSMGYKAEDPFELLVGAILSQHTSDVNSWKAYLNLKKAIGKITPKKLMEISEKELSKHIWSAGLSKIKTRRLKLLSEKILKNFNGSLRVILRKPLREARQSLLALPGVGPKTVDVVLAFSAGMPVVPVDTHLFTIARRLKISNSNKYEDVRAAYERLIPENLRAEGHLLLLNLGKKYCSARNPKCFSCPIRSLCPSFKPLKGQS